jgi:hypothetical protein
MNHSKYVRFLDDEALTALHDAVRAEIGQRRVQATRRDTAEDFIELIEAQKRADKAAEIQRTVNRIHWRLGQTEQDLRDGKLTDHSWHFADCKQCLRAIYEREYVGLCVEGRASFAVLLNR